MEICSALYYCFISNSSAILYLKHAMFLCNYTVFQKNRTPETLYYNFAKIALYQ